MQKTNKLGLFALILISFFCLSVEAKDDDYMIKILKETAHRFERIKLEAAKLEKEIQTKDGEIAKLKEQIKAKESEIARLKSDAGKAKRDSNGEISERNSQIETLEGEKTALQGELDAAKKKIEELEKQEAEPEKKLNQSSASPFMLILQVLTLLCSICAIVLLIKNSLTIKDFSETHWRD